MNLYRFSGPYKWSAPFTKSFNNDDEAFQYASEMVDGPEMVSVEKFMVGGDWFGWDYINQRWIYLTDAPKESCPHIRPDGSIYWGTCQQPTV